MTNREIASVIHLSEAVPNKKLISPLEAEGYIVARVRYKMHGERETWAFFTFHELSRAVQRARKNPEDAQKLKPMGRFKKLFKRM